ncbi:MAG: NMD3-related protein [Candidatus Methanomethylicia archaeon]|nr:NMD3-related protein [Candidatus Methanomethylicia archaeon]
MTRFCSICGVHERNDKPLVDNLCWDCYKAKNRLIIPPKKLLVMEFCSSCCSYKLRGNWIKSNRIGDPLLSSAMDFVEHYVKINGVGVVSAIDAKKVGRERIFVLINASGTVNPIIPKYNEELWIEIRFKNIICPICSRMASGTFSSIVQIRAENRKLNVHEIKHVNEIVNSILYRASPRDRSTLNYKVELTHGGIDYKFDNFKLAKKIAVILQRSFGAMLKESHKVVGYNASRGTKLSRLSISIRLPKFSVGDVIEFNGKILRYEGFMNGKFLFYDLESESKFSINYNDGWSNKVGLVCKWNDLIDGSIQSISNNYVEVIDLNGKIYRTLPPKNMELREGDNVKLLVLNNKIIIISKKQ